MTMLRDQLSAMADSVDIPPAPTVLDLERGARETRRVDRRWVIAAAAAAAVVAAGSIAWFSRDDDRVEPVGPPTWSDVDVPWTADGVLHWRDARVEVEPLTAYGQGQDVLWLLKDGTLTEVDPDGSTEVVAQGVVGPLAVDPDSAWVAWSDGQGLFAYDADDGTRWEEADQDNVLVTALSAGVLDAIGPEGGLEVSVSGDESTDVAPGGTLPSVLDRRAGWRVESVGDTARTRALSDAGESVALGRGIVVSIGPSAGYVAAMTVGDAVVVTDLATGVRTPLGLPAGSTLGDAGYRWTGDASLVVPATPDPEADDPMVSWYVCSAPGWGCEPMDVPDQRRSEIPLLASVWNFALARGESSGGASASASVETSTGPTQPDPSAG